MTTTETLDDLLRRDLAAFADPGEAVDIEPLDGGWRRATWVHNGKTRSADFLIGENGSFGEAIVRQRETELPYRSFLASTAFADLQAVARNTIGVLGSKDPFVPALAKADTASGGADVEAADELILRLLEPSEERTSVVFLTADAGDGKTTLMKRLAVQRAEAFMSGQAEQLWLYVDAQGSRLARLDQALAQALDEVRAPFPYHATAPLVRVGALALVIDGFDELIGTTGSYDEAYGSLSTFLESLGGSGSVIAVARSAYYEQEFAARVNQSIGFAAESWELHPVELLDWEESQRREYVRLACAAVGEPQRAPEIETHVEQTFADSDLAPLAGKPLFVSRVTSLLLDGESLTEGELPLDRLVNAYIDREIRTKLTSAELEPLITDKLFRDVMEELADEMWRQESRALSRTTVRELMELFADVNGLDSETTAVLEERVPYVAFLRTGEEHGTTAFEHELFFAYFLVQPLLRTLSNESSFTLSQALRRGRLPFEAAFLAGREMRTGNPTSVLDLLAEASARASTPVARRNAGSVALGLLSELPPTTRIALSHLSFIDLRFGPIELRDVTLLDVDIASSDLSEAQILASSGKSVRLNDVLVSSHTRLELEGVPLAAVNSVRTRGDSGAVVTYYAPAEIRAVLEPTSFPAAQSEPPLRKVDASAVETLERLMRVFSHTNLMTEEDPEMVRNVVVDRDWPSLRGVLLDSGILVQERRGASGSKTFFRFRGRPSDVLAAHDPTIEASDQIDAFWRELEARFPG